MLSWGSTTSRNGPDQIQTLFYGTDRTHEVFSACVKCTCTLTYEFHVTLRDWFYFSMAVPFRVCTTLLSSEEVEKILDDPPSDKVLNLSPVKPKGGEVYLFKPADDSQKVLYILDGIIITIRSYYALYAHHYSTDIPIVAR